METILEKYNKQGWSWSENSMGALIIILTSSEAQMGIYALA